MMKRFAPDAFNAFTDEQWQAYHGICLKWPAPINWNEARRYMEQACRAYSAIEAAREAKRRSAEYEIALNGAERSLELLQMWLGRLNEMAPSDLHGLPDVRVIGRRFSHLRARYKKWSTPLAGRNNRIRETFDNRLLAIWEEQFHGRIRSSKGTSPTPTGPLIRFLTLTYKIVLGKWALGPSGARSIIERAKKRRRGYSPKTKSAKHNLRQRKGN